MQITAGQTYTFQFIPSGTYLGIGSLADDAIQQLQQAAFPISKATGATEGFLGGLFGGNSISITFTYTGADTDDATFGNAMATELTNDFTALSFQYNGASGGNAPTPSVIDKFKAAVGITQNPTATPSLSTIGLIALVVVLLAIAVYSFAGAAGHEAAARV